MQLVVLVGLQGSGKSSFVRAREGAQRIPARGVLGTAARLELPSLDEGFDALYYVRVGDQGFEVRGWQP